MSATAEAKQPSRRVITVITQKNLPAHLRQTQPYDSLLSAESSPLLSPPPPYQQFEQGSEYNVCLCWIISIFHFQFAHAESFR